MIKHKESMRFEFSSHSRWRFAGVGLSLKASQATKSNKFFCDGGEGGPRTYMVKIAIDSRGPRTTTSLRNA